MIDEDDYQETKLIKQGKKILSRFQQEIANWVSQTYDVTVLNLLFDFINSPEKSPRIGVIVETFEEYSCFTELPHGVGDYKKDCEVAVRKRFCDLIKEYKFKDDSVVDELFKKMNLNWTKINAEEIFVFFSHFSTPAKSEASQNIPKDKINIFINKYLTHPIWDIHRHPSSLTVFFLH